MARHMVGPRRCTRLLALIYIFICCVTAEDPRLVLVSNANNEGMDISLTPVLTEARAIQEKYGYVMQTILNSAFLDIAKSFLCHLPNDDNVLDRMLWLAADEETFTTLKTLGVLHVVLVPYASGSLRCGWKDYYDFSLFRQSLLQHMLESGINIWVFETDATWYADPSPYLEAFSGYDVVFGQDGYFHEDTPETGFVFYNATEKTIELMKAIRKGQEDALRDAPANAKIGIRGAEMPGLAALSDSLNVKRTNFPREYFVSGKWYFPEDRPEAREFRANTCPVVIQWNYVIGVESKVGRAKNTGSWFLTHKGECKTEPAIVQRVYMHWFTREDETSEWLPKPIAKKAQELHVEL